MDVNIHDRCAEAIALVLTNLGLTVNDQDLNIYHLIFPDERTANFPAFFVTHEGDSEQLEIAAFEYHFDVTYPVRVWLVDRMPVTDVDLRRTFLSFRKQAIDALRPLTALSDSTGPIPGVYDVQVIPNVIFDPRLPHYQYMISGFLVRVLTRDANYMEG